MFTGQVDDYAKVGLLDYLYFTKLILPEFKIKLRIQLCLPFLKTFFTWF